VVSDGGEQPGSRLPLDHLDANYRRVPGRSQLAQPSACILAAVWDDGCEQEHGQGYPDISSASLTAPEAFTRLNNLFDPPELDALLCGPMTGPRRMGAQGGTLGLVD
jgi:hypothetical protein